MNPQEIFLSDFKNPDLRVINMVLAFIFVPEKKTAF